MKRLFQLCLLIGFNVNVSAQNYHPFPDSAIIWRENFSGLGFNCCCSGICVHEEQYQYFIGGDTLIGQNQYKKILKTGNGVEYVTGPPQCPPWCLSNYQYFYFNDEYKGAIRQDTVQRKVFYVAPSTSQDTLLYDFSLQVGDTVPYTWNNNYPVNIISSTDSILIGNAYHKRFWLSVPGVANDYVSIIEGIGSDYGLLYMLEPPFEFINTLVCVSINGVPVYPDTATVCSMASEIPEHSMALNFTVIPNPATETATLLLPVVPQNAELRILNLLGKPVLRIPTCNTSTAIQLNNLTPGMYFIEVKARNGIMGIQKLLIE